MGVTKSELYTTEQNEVAKMAKALAHPARLAILQHLLDTMHASTVISYRNWGLRRRLVVSTLGNLRRQN